MTTVFKTSKSNPGHSSDTHCTPIQDIENICMVLGKVKPANINKVASLHSRMILDYYQDVRMQAQQSFHWALIWAGIGLCFFIYAVIAWIMHQSLSSSIPMGSVIGVIAGTLVQVISGINFKLYSQAARQFASFHICLERINRFLLSNTLCENLVSEANKDKMRQKLIWLIANAPALRFSVVSGSSDQNAPRTNKEKIINKETFENLKTKLGTEISEIHVNNGKSKA